MAMNSRTEISIGERLRFYRKAKGQKQVVVAGLAGITEDYLSQIERGMRTPTIGLLQKLARILRVPVATLLGEPEFEQDGIVHPVASVIQRALTSYGADDDAIGTADLTELRERVTNAWSIWHTSPNVNLHAVSVEMEAGESAEGLRLADEVDVSRVAARERQMTFYLEVARCYDQRREDPAVLVHLIDAERTAPEDMRYDMLARDLVRGLVRRARPTYATQVRGLAQRIGLPA
jgi:transcriptional regulator with XRE-family HTH domain